MLYVQLNGLSQLKDKQKGGPPASFSNKPKMHKLYLIQITDFIIRFKYNNNNIISKDHSKITSLPFFLE